MRSSKPSRTATNFKAIEIDSSEVGNNNDASELSTTTSHTIKSLKLSKISTRLSATSSHMIKVDSSIPTQLLATSSNSIEINSSKQGPIEVKIGDTQLFDLSLSPVVQNRNNT
ncbi:33687_t:CDS:2, partial [Racocetra persica]